MKISPDSAQNENLFSFIKNTETTITAGVNRKVNIGNYENIDLYSSITLPIDIGKATDMEELKSLLKEAYAEAFSITSRETNDRMQLIKEHL